MKKTASQLNQELNHALLNKIISLIDSGNGEKLERFDSQILCRPSSLAIWDQRQSSQSWKNAHGTYQPKAAWRLKNNALQDWQIDLGAFKLKLNLQDNGQIGCFPEHISYFNLLSDSIEAIKTNNTERPRVLNLFAYTGMASVWCALHDCKVTHVEIAKRVIEWAKENIAINNIPTENMRYIAEDAIAFTQREVRRNSQYDLIIADPPSFSRLSKNSTWDLEIIAKDFLADLMKLLKPGGTLYFTSHSQVLSAYAVGNLMLDIGGVEVKLQKPLLLIEDQTGRTLEAGNLVLAQKL